MTVPFHQPAAGAAAADPREPDRRLEQLAERERALRSQLFDARDALHRAEVGASPPGDGEGGRTAGRLAYDEVRRRMRKVLDATLPHGASILVVSRGDDGLLETDVAARARHFPCTRGGAYAGHHPADSAEAIAHLEEQRAGAGFLVFPATARWWLDHYTDLARHLGTRYRKMIDEPGTCVVYDLRGHGTASPQARVRARAARNSEAGGRPLAAVTIISRNYLSQARVLARSFLEHEPESRFYMLVVDRLPEGEEVGPEVTLIDPLELGIPDLYEMCFKYGIVEFNTAVKPFVLSLLLDEYGEEEVAYFDPDILIMRPLAELREALDGGDIVLTPHILRPLPLDGERPSEQDIMISGAYNLGFIALRRSPQTAEFLTWWQDRLRDGCRIDVPNGLFTDQKWIDLVPSLFPSATILRDATYNVAFWNLHERAISIEDEDGDGLLVNGSPAAFFHISGFDPQAPHNLSKHQTRTEVAEGSALGVLLDRYAELLLGNGYEEVHTWEYGYERFDNSVRVHPLLRQLYLNLSSEERRRFGDPFSTAGPDSFLEWAIRPDPEHGGLSRFLQTIYRLRYDLPLAFPDARGRDRDAFVRWARRWGSVEMQFDPELVRDPDGSADGSARPAAFGSGRSAPPPAPGDGIERIRNIVRSTLPAGSKVLVVSKGDYRLVELGGCDGWHFPQTEDGVYGGYHPPDSAVAIAHLEALRAKGANYLLIPRTAFWWLEFYEAFRRHLEERYRLVVEDRDACLIYSLRGTDRGLVRRRSRRRPWWRWLAGRAGAVAEAREREETR